MKDLSRAAAILFLFLLPFSAQATNSLQVVVNEIAWMGGEESFADEWIELYNNADNAVGLGGWVLKAVDGTPEISLEGTILAKSFYLLERTNEETVPGIKADLIYKGSLNNKGEHLELINPQGEMVDEIDCSSKWFAGDNNTKQTMEKADAENWQTSRNPGGTPKAKNSLGAELDYNPPATPKIETKKELAVAGEKKPGKPSFLPLSAALTIAVFSGIIILILKRKVKIS
jgi:hypothetical protein